MRVFRTSYKDKTGRKRQAAKWYIELRDHRETVRRFPAFTDKRQSEALGRQIEKLINFKTAGQQPDTELSRWLENIPARMRNHLLKIGLLDAERAAAGKLLSAHLDDFEKHLQAKGSTTKHVKLTMTRIRRVCSDCKFVSWSDITGSRVQEYLSDCRKGDNGFSAQTFNYYLQAMKQFAKWMVLERRANLSSVKHLRPLNTRTDRRHDRRALEPDEIRHLLEVTRCGPKRFWMTGPERAMLYRLAVETGLRAGELRSLIVSSFDFVGCTVTVEAGDSKRRRQDIIPLRPDTAAELKDFFRGKLPHVAAFKMPDKTSDMIKADLADAGISYVDESGRYADFHSLRHTTGSLLAASGAHPKVAQSLMRHSTIDLTLSRYTHIYGGQESEAVNNLPDLSLPSSKYKAAATGTEGTEKNLASYLALSCGKQRISADKDGQNREKFTGTNVPPKSKFTGAKSGILATKSASENTSGVRDRTGDLRAMNPPL